MPAGRSKRKRRPKPNARDLSSIGARFTFGPRVTYGGTLAIEIGTNLGPYEIVSLLGAGGMGEVYRARDTRLGRDVALKTLPANVAADPSRRQRFELEARAVAALKHPNIVAVFDVGAAEGVSYIVSELVEGESLHGAKFASRKAIDIAVQIAAGLAAAHDAGIIHRDLKPDNILLTASGLVKILDFGLAKISAIPAGGAAGATETFLTPTEPGVVMGTASYMSPEQIRGLTADPRSDIFSLGLILYELLTGTRAFRHETSAETLTAILKQEPADLPETVPAGLRQVIAHCIEKDPTNRFQSAKDLSFALRSLALSGTQPESAAGFSKTARPRLRRRRLIAMTAAAIVIAAVVIAVFWLRTPPVPSWSGVMLGGPQPSFTPRVSPDGHTLAFQVMVDGLNQVAVMKPESGNWAILTHSRSQGAVVETSWSPDGTTIYFDRITDVPQGIYSVPVLGGEERLILENAAWPEALPDGSFLVKRRNAQRQSQIFRFWPETGRLQGFPVSSSSWFGSIRAFPDGREAVVVGTRIGESQASGKHVYILDLGSNTVRRLPTGLPDESKLDFVAVNPDGKSVLLTSSSGDLHRIVAVPRNGRSPARTLLTLTLPANAIDMASDGSLYLDQNDMFFNLQTFPVQGGHPQNIASLRYPEMMRNAVLPDGRAILPQAFGGRSRLVVVETGKEPVPFINTAEETSGPVTLAGKREIAFLIGPESKRMIALAMIANGRITRRIPFDKGRITSLASTPDGSVLYAVADGTIWSIPASGGEIKKFRAGDAIAVDPDGKYMMVEVSESPQTRLLRIPVSGGPEQEIPLSGPLHLAAPPVSSNAINKDGLLLAPLASTDSFFFLPGVVNLATGSMKRIPLDQFGDYQYIGWGPDGKVVALAAGFRATIWRFQPERR